ncbi:hypothetical protein [Microbulbifer sp. DLAB2-AA]|uniref:hypothetical protein n=1 Tax=Microbulbifer sp. DLAB2-AA TaxID=3243394 RepID=UPI004039E910
MSKYLLFFSLLLPSLAFSAGGSTDTGVIEVMYVNGGWTMVRLPALDGAQPGSKNNPDSCPNSSYYALQPDTANYEALHSTLLAAQLANKKVNFWVSGCGGQSNQYPKISSVYLYSN